MESPIFSSSKGWFLTVPLYILYLVYFSIFGGEGFQATVVKFSQ